MLRDQAGVVELAAFTEQDEHRRRDLTRTYAAYYALVLASPGMDTQQGTAYPGALERFLAKQLHAAGVSSPDDSPTVAAGLLAMTNGLGSGVLGGQRDGPAALAVLTYHLGQLFH